MENPNETRLTQKSCAHTAVDRKYNVFWSVEFPPRLVTEYVLYDRTEADHLNGFTLTAFPKTDRSLTFKDTVKKSKIYRILDPRKNVVSNVTITRASVLNICEVEVYGECPTGTWGLACTNCSQDCPNECHVENGRCVKLCLGFTNPPSCDQRM
uniref:Fucolectin tachylectin-4 pentraxin-1 domain-containing protein n=1 Tax=Biomphalaria glabrata TaxID=6526 RepID=A0A2C9KHY1_BIOGL